VDFIETFSYVIKYKQNKDNIVVVALSTRYVLIFNLNVRLLRSEYIKDLYANDNDFVD
jgi:hypothetical protein